MRPYASGPFGGGHDVLPVFVMRPIWTAVEVPKALALSRAKVSICTSV